MYATLSFDVEDVFCKKGGDLANNLDGIVKWLADTLRNNGLIGDFNLIGDKARLLKKRNRIDVIKSLKYHDLGSHTNKGSRHPTVFEYLEDKNWKDGISEIERREGKGLEELSRIMGKKADCMSSHICTDAAQFIYWTGKKKMPYTQPVFNLPGHNVTWYTGTLCFGWWLGGFDKVYDDDKRFNEKLDGFKNSIRKLKEEKYEFVNIYLCHPMGFRSHIYTDRYWAVNGKNLSKKRWGEWGYPPLKTRKELDRAKRNFIRLIKFIKHSPDLEVTSYKDLYRIFGRQRDIITRADLKRIALDMVDAGKKPEENEVLIDILFSPAEAVYALSQSVLIYKQNRQLPEGLKKKDVLGPMDFPVIWPEGYMIKGNKVFELAGYLVDFVDRNGYLPSNFRLGKGDKLGLGSYYLLICEVYERLSEGKKIPDEMSLKSVKRYPNIATDLGQRFTNMNDSFLYKPDLEMCKIIKYVKLQTWTLKPAEKSV